MRVLARRLLSSAAAGSSSKKPATAAAPVKFFERKDRYETYKPSDDLDLDPALATSKADLLGRRKLLAKEKEFEQQQQQQTATPRHKLNKFVAVDRGSLDFNRLVCQKTNSFADVCKLVVAAREGTFDAVNCSTALLQLAKSPQRQQQQPTSTELTQQALTKLVDSALAMPSSFPPRQTSNALYALALGKFSSDVLPQDKFDALLDKLVSGTSRLDWQEWEPQHMASAAWSLAKLRQEERAVNMLSQVARQSRLLGMRRFNTYDLSQLEFALAKSAGVLVKGKNPEDASQVVHLCQAITRNRGFPSFTTENLVDLFDSLLTHYEGSGGGDQGIPAQYLNHLCEEIGNRRFYSAREIVSLLKCFARCGGGGGEGEASPAVFEIEPEFLSAILAQLSKDFAKLKPRRVQELAQALQQLKINVEDKHPELAQKISLMAKREA